MATSITPVGANASGHFDVSDQQFIKGGLAPLVTFGSSAIGNGNAQYVDGGTIFASPLFGLGTLFGTGKLSGPGQPQAISGGLSEPRGAVSGGGTIAGGGGSDPSMICYIGERWYFDFGLGRWNFGNGLPVPDSSPILIAAEHPWKVYAWGGGDMSALAALAPPNSTVYGYICNVEQFCFSTAGLELNNDGESIVCFSRETLGGHPTVQYGPLGFVDVNNTNLPVDVFGAFPAVEPLGLLYAQPGETVAFWQRGDVHAPDDNFVHFHNPLGYDYYGNPLTAGSLQFLYVFSPGYNNAGVLQPTQTQTGSKYYFVYYIKPDPVGTGPGTPSTLPPGIKSGCVDGTHLYGNMLAWAENCGGASLPGGSKVQSARVQICRPVLAGKPNISSSVALDTNAKEIIGGAQVIWLDSKALVCIYQQRDTLGGAWNYWWRINPVAGIQDTQPVISNGVEGNWSARQSVNVPTAEWCQIARGQGRIVALYNTGTLTSAQSNAGAGTTTVYTRTAGNLMLIYALDAQCSSWSAPITVATGVAPCFGGICYTGEEWVVCYTRNSDLASVQRSSGRLDDWSGSTETATGLTRPADTGGTAAQVPQKPLHCQSLAYDARNIIQGLWTTYDDSPATYTPSGGGTAYITYGYYLNVISPDQGRTWKLPYANGRQGGVKGDRTLGGMATLVDEVAFIMPQASGLGRGTVTASSSAFYLDAGTLSI